MMVVCCAFVELLIGEFCRRVEKQKNTHIHNQACSILILNSSREICHSTRGRKFNSYKGHTMKLFFENFSFKSFFSYPLSLRPGISGYPIRLVWVVKLFDFKALISFGGINFLNFRFCFKIKVYF